MKNVKRFLIGVPVLIIGLALFTGGFGNALLLLYVSIVCTGGVGLALWIPLTIGLGVATIGIYTALLGRRILRNKEPEEHTLTHDQQALRDYITRMKSQSVTTDEIKTMLRSNGWNDTVIDEAMKKYVYSEFKGSPKNK